MNRLSQSYSWDGGSDWEIYCPVCQRTITASNIEEVNCGEHDGYVFVHDDIIHSDSDVTALESGVQ